MACSTTLDEETEPPITHTPRFGDDGSSKSAFSGAVGACQRQRRRHHVLTVLVAECLADRCLGAGLETKHARREGPHPNQAEHLAVDVQPRQSLPCDGVVRSTVTAHEREHVVGGRSPSPERTLTRERDAFVAERDLGEPPPVVDLADELPGRDADLLEGHLVEVSGAVHLLDRLHGDPRRPHVDDEVRDALVLCGRAIGAREQDSPA